MGNVSLCDYHCTSRAGLVTCTNCNCQSNYCKPAKLQYLYQHRVSFPLYRRIRPSSYTVAYVPAPIPSHTSQPLYRGIRPSPYTVAYVPAPIPWHTSQPLYRGIRPSPYTVAYVPAPIPSHTSQPLYRRIRSSPYTVAYVPAPIPSHTSQPLYRSIRPSLVVSQSGSSQPEPAPLSTLTHVGPVVKLRSPAWCLPSVRGYLWPSGDWGWGAGGRPAGGEGWHHNSPQWGAQPML